MTTVRGVATKSADSKVRPKSGAVPSSWKKPGPTTPTWTARGIGAASIVLRVNSGRT